LTFRSVVLENEFLTATFLPELGGRLTSLLYRPLNRELLHRNPVFQPANLAIRNAWFSGGIEWNIGQYGHTFTTCTPVFASAIQGTEGLPDAPGLRIYEYERCKGLFWQVDFYLPSKLPFLVAYTRVINPSDSGTSMYWWTNVAVNESPGVRVLSPASHAIYIDFSQSDHGFGYTTLPALPSLNGADGTYSLNSTFANEFFFQCDGQAMPWEAALGPEGDGFVEASTARLKYRKLFCWGTHTGGRHWQEFLAEPGQAYLEIQAGLAPTQRHGLPIPGRTTWDWTQVFGYLAADPAQVHNQNWPDAVSHVDSALKTKISADRLYLLEQTCRLNADVPSTVILQAGSGWGALELARRSSQPNLYPVPASFYFSSSTLGPEQRKWQHLLERGEFPTQDPALLPGEWMVQPEWEKLLNDSIAKKADWFALLHQGVMRMERGDESGAAEAWQASIALQPSAWAYRNLAVLSLRQDNPAAAFEYYEKAWEQACLAGQTPAALAIEYLQALNSARQYERAAQVYQSLPAEVQTSERIQILRGQAALGLGDLAVVEEVLQIEYAGVREGETSLTDMWFELWARRESQRTSRPLDDALRAEIQNRFLPPARIDFRSKNE
jgi:tetratricopeptide (TPR) repeat protein